MPAFTLYSAPGSSNADRVRLMLAEAGFTDYETVLLNLRKGEQKSPEHMKRHPWGKVPVATFPDGLVLYESRAICQYLDKKFNFGLIPTDLAGEALFAQAQSVEMIYFGEPASRINFELFAKKHRGLPADEAVVAASLQAARQYFDVAETLLQKNDYMAGSTFTLVDIYYIPLIQRLFILGYGEEFIVKRPAVHAWWQRVISRPRIQNLIAADKEAAAKAAAAAAP